MRLRNKKTGEIVNDVEFRIYTFIDGFGIRTAEKDYNYTTLAKLVGDWEDYTYQEPLIKDEKIRKAVRAWAEANGIDEVGYIRCREESVFADDNTSIVFYGEITYLDENKDYTIAELCGESNDD